MGFSEVKIAHDPRKVYGLLDCGYGMVCTAKILGVDNSSVGMLVKRRFNLRCRQINIIAADRRFLQWAQTIDGELHVRWSNKRPSPRAQQIRALLEFGYGTIDIARMLHISAEAVRKCIDLSYETSCNEIRWDAADARLSYLAALPAEYEAPESFVVPTPPATAPMPVVVGKTRHTEAQRIYALLACGYAIPEITKMTGFSGHSIRKCIETNYETTCSEVRRTAADVRLNQLAASAAA